MRPHDATATVPPSTQPLTRCQACMSEASGRASLCGPLGRQHAPGQHPAHATVHQSKGYSTLYVRHCSGGFERVACRGAWCMAAAGWQSPSSLSGRCLQPGQGCTRSEPTASRSCERFSSRARLGSDRCDQSTAACAAGAARRHEEVRLRGLQKMRAYSAVVGPNLEEHRREIK